MVIFIVTFALIVYRKINIAYISLTAAGLLILTGITNPAEAFLRGVNWDVLAIYWGYSMLSVIFSESKVPALVVNQALIRVKKEKYALIFLCVLAMALSSFLPNPVVVIMLAPIAIEMAERLKASLFLYMIVLAISANVVTTVSMIADPPALILAMTTGMNFLDFYWFQGKIGLGTLSVIGIAVALLALVFQFRRLNNQVSIAQQEMKVSWIPTIIFILSIIPLAAVRWNSLGTWNHPGIVGLALGISCLAIGAGKNGLKAMLKESDVNTLSFLVGIFILVATVDNVGLLRAFTAWLSSLGLNSTTVYLAIFIWLSVALSSFIDNVPYTVLMIPVCTGVAQALGVNPFPFYFGMLVGTGIGGNITPVGATANVLACGMLEKRGYKIELGKYMAIAVPFSVSAVLAVHILLQLFWL